MDQKAGNEDCSFVQEEWEKLLFDSSTKFISSRKTKMFRSENGEKIHLPLYIKVRRKVSKSKIVKTKKYKLAKHELYILGRGSSSVVGEYCREDRKQSFALKCSVQKLENGTNTQSSEIKEMVQFRRIDLTAGGNNQKQACYYVMPKMDGNLREFFGHGFANLLDEESKKMRAAVAKKVLGQVQSIFARTEIAHLDLKPSNVLYRKSELCVQFTIFEPNTVGLVPSAVRAPELTSYTTPKTLEEKARLLSWSAGVFLLHAVLPKVTAHAFLEHISQKPPPSQEPQEPQEPSQKEEIFKTFIKETQQYLQEYLGSKTITQLLCYDAEKRISLDQALQELEAYIQSQSHPEPGHPEPKLSRFQRAVNFFSRKKKK